MRTQGHAQGGSQTAAVSPSTGLWPGRGRRLRSQLSGALILLATTVLWASGGPTTKYLFLLPTPPSAALLTACISVITALFLGVGLVGSVMDAGGGRGDPHNPADGAAASGGGGVDERPFQQAAAATDPRLYTARRRTRSGGGGGSLADVDETEAEAEALLHCGMHTTGAAGAGAALVAAAAVAREAAQEQEREAAWQRVAEQSSARAQEGVLPPITSSQGSHHYVQLDSRSRGEWPGLEADVQPEALTAAKSPWETVAAVQQRLSNAALGRDETGPSGGGSGGGGTEDGSGGGGWPGGVSQRQASGGGKVQGHVSERRGPSLDGTTAGPIAPASPPPRLRAFLSGGGGSGGGGGGGSRGGSRSSGGGAGAAGQSPGRWHLRALTAPASSLPAAGLELGIYNVTAAALGAWGMQRISATRSAFLAQATSLLTPLLVWLSGGRVGLVVWAACCCGAVGGAMVALDNVYGAAAAATATDGGGGAAAATDGSSARRLLEALGGGATDLTATEVAAAPLLGPPGTVEGVLLSRQSMGAIYVLLSCVFWGLGTVRLGVHSARFQPLHLAAAAAMCYSALSLLWLLGEILGSPLAGLADFLELNLLLRNHVTAALLLWAGLGPGALSSYLQVLGQQTVPPAQAQVLFSSTPLWSALLAQLLLPGETIGPLAWVGGAVMLGASLLASLWQ